MATKNAGTTEHAPEGKIAVSNVAQWSEEKKTRLQALQVSEDLTEQEANELVSLIKARKAHNEQRAGSIAETRQALKALHITIKDLFSKEEIKADYSLTDLFTREEIIDGAGQYQRTSAPAKKAASTGSKKGAAPVTEEAKANSMLTIKTDTRPVLWPKGKVWSDPYLSEAFGTFKKDAHASGMDLEQYVLSKVTPTAKEYLTSDDAGKKELTAFVTFLTSKKTKKEAGAARTAKTPATA